MWCLQGVPHACLGGEVHHAREPLLGKQLGHGLAVREVNVLETKIRVLAQQ